MVTTDEQKRLEEIKRAYDEFEAGLAAIHQEMRSLISRTITKIDQKQAQKILERIQS